ncbi:hypothetical protein DY000_02015324 [Brassica cretica]|uniref:Uncharacterized protein n=1 Tax=Brassica cretica TaxID=69181 RepID=A0ABQ7CP67_BRACR|nr:hypothetical protein DY000_02015324 [Brassica cretica]
MDGAIVSSEPPHHVVILSCEHHQEEFERFSIPQKTEIVAPKPIGFHCSFNPLLGRKVSLQPDIFKRQASCCYTQNTFAAENLLRETSRHFSTITMPAGKKTSRKRK